MSGDDLIAIRERVAHIVRELGLVVHHAEEAFDNPGESKPQVAEDLGTAMDAANCAEMHLDALCGQLTRLSDEADSAASAISAVKAPVQKPTLKKTSVKKGPCHAR